MSKFFAKVEDPSGLLPIVDERLPMSCAIFNQIKSYDKFKDEMDILTYGENKPDSLWIIIVYKREDYGPWISISPPSEEYGVEMPGDVKEALLSGEIFNWDEKFILTSLPRHISWQIFDLILDGVGNVVTIYPSYLYYMTPEDALQLEINSPPGTQVKRLDPEHGTSFITKNWKYTRDGTIPFTRKGIEHLPSGGAYVGDDYEPVCGAMTPGFGLISVLHTNPEHRRKGYASLVMKFILKELAQEGLQPCMVTVLENKGSVKFHRALGLTPLAKVTFIARGWN